MRWEEHAMQIWHVLIGAAHNRQTLTYEKLGEFIGMGGGNIYAQALKIVMTYCESKGLPPLTVLVVKKDTGKPGAGLTTVQDYDRGREAVYAQEWYKMPPVQIQDFEALKGGC